MDCAWCVLYRRECVCFLVFRNESTEYSERVMDNPPYVDDYTCNLPVCCCHVVDRIDS